MFNVPPTAKVIWRQGNDSSDILEGLGGDETQDYLVQGQSFIFYTRADLNDSDDS